MNIQSSSEIRNEIIKKFDGYNSLAVTPVNTGNRNAYRNDRRGGTKARLKTEVKKIIAISSIIFLLIPMVWGVMTLIEPQSHVGEPISGGGFAAMLIGAVDSMSLPYEIKVNLLGIDDSGEFFNMVNNSLDRRNQIQPDSPITREQSAYMIDFLLRYIAVNYRQAGNILTHLPRYISRSMFEGHIRRSITDTRDRRTLEGQYAVLMDLTEPEMSETARLARLSSFPVLERTAVYILSPAIGNRERRHLIEMLNNYGAVTDADIIRMNMHYGIVQRYAPIIPFAPLYLSNLPDMSGINEQARSAIENAFIRTTLADRYRCLTQDEYDYIISEYTRRYATTLHYRRLRDDIMPDEKEEIQAIFDRYPEIMIDITDIIPIDEFREVLDTVSLDYRWILNLHYTKYTKQSLTIPCYEQIDIYVLRDDLTAEEKLRLETFGFAVHGKHSAAFLKINTGDFLQSHIERVSPWARDSVEIMYRTNIMQDARMYNFNPAGRLTIDEAYAIIGNIVSGMMVY